MKTTKRFLAVLALLILPTAGRCQTSPPNTSLTIHLPQATVKAELKPSQTTDEQIYLSKIYDFTPGQYTVQISQTTYASDTDAKAARKTVTKSNSVTITVTK